MTEKELNIEVSNLLDEMEEDRKSEFKQLKANYEHWKRKVKESTKNMDRVKAAMHREFGYDPEAKKK